ncbi:MAG: acyl--CoA ligase [Proteobacteria bacterium]|nr:acyl--CoA ligase [Pseudomonadota bacterium]HQR03033.1 class I adenylate-forming enzyme family protein [Rhodocyclaceae bacterium]
MNLAMLLEMAAETFPDRVAVKSGDRQLTYGQLLAAAHAAAHHFKASNARYVGLLDVSSPIVPVAIFGAAFAGIPYVPMNYRLTPPELDELLARIAPAVLIADPEYTARLTIPQDVAVFPADRFAAHVMNTVAEPLIATADPGEVAIQLFTSGTTGKPKAAVLRHENLMSYILGTVEFAAAAEEDAILITVPPYHIAGISAVLSSTYACRRMVQLPNFDAREWLRLCGQEHVSNAFLVPTMLGRVIDHLETGAEAAELPALRAIAYGGGKMPLPVIDKALKRWPHVDFTNAYGLTETSSTIALLSPDDHRAAAASSDPAIRKRLGSVGRPLETIELQIRDETGKVLETGQSGLIFVRGGQVSGEYLGLGSQLDSDGWFPTKDRGYLDDGGYLFLEGRDDDVIVRGGENISPGEVEDVLLDHPDVIDAAVFSIADDQWGEAVAAAIVLREHKNPSVAELQDWVRSRLRSSRVPAAVHFTGQLPYNETGKLLRRVLRQQFPAR